MKLDVKDSKFVVTNDSDQVVYLGTSYYLACKAMNGGVILDSESDKYETITKSVGLTPE